MALLVAVELSSGVRSISLLNSTLNFTEIIPFYFPFRALGGTVDPKDIRAFSGGFSEVVSRQILTSSYLVLRKLCNLTFSAFKDVPGSRRERLAQMYSVNT